MCHPLSKVRTCSRTWSCLWPVRTSAHFSFSRTDPWTQLSFVGFSACFPSHKSNACGVLCFRGEISTEQRCPSASQKIYLFLNWEMNHVPQARGDITQEPLGELRGPTLMIVMWISGSTMTEGWRDTLHASQNLHKHFHM